MKSTPYILFIYYARLWHCHLPCQRRSCILQMLHKSIWEGLLSMQGQRAFFLHATRVRRVCLYSTLQATNVRIRVFCKSEL